MGPRDNPGQLPPKKEVIEELYKKFVENFEILHADIPNEEVLRRKWAACGNYYQLKTWLANRLKRASEATVHDPMFRKIMSQTPGQTPSIEVVTDLYNKCVENLALLNVPNEETLLKLWQRFGALNRIQGWYDAGSFLQSIGNDRPCHHRRSLQSSQCMQSNDRERRYNEQYNDGQKPFQRVRFEVREIRLNR